MLCKNEYNGFRLSKQLINKSEIQFKMFYVKNLLCSDCFRDYGLRIQAQKIGLTNDHEDCNNCYSATGKKLSKELLEKLAESFFVRGSLLRHKFGAAPRIQCNYYNRYGDDFAGFSESLKKDMELFASVIGLSFFYYDPRLWMIGENEPLKALQKKKTRKIIIERILNEYPIETLDINRNLYRLRKNPSNEKLPIEYDSPPVNKRGKGRFESATLPIMYCSQEIESCIHECRTTAEDDLYLAILNPTKKLHVLNLAKILQDDTTEFESLDIGVHMLFMAGKHSYKLSREIAVDIKNAGLDGVMYPSYFSSLQTGAQPLEAVIGLSIRKIPHLKEVVEAETKPNVALFGRPLEEGKVKINCISRVVIKKVTYDFDLGPVDTVTAE